MRTLRLISATAAIMLLGAGAVSAQDTKTDQTPGARAGTAPKVSSESQGSADVTSKRTARHVGTRYADRRHGPIYDSYQGDPGYYGSAWGCAHASSNGNFGIGYAHRTQAEAKSVALAACGRQGGNGCYIISCSPKADTEAQALALWPQESPGPGSFHCGSPGEPNC
jgi:hypothetical protein